MKIQQSEESVYEAVLTGELKIDHQGRIWRTGKRHPHKGTGGMMFLPCVPRRAENRVAQGYLQVRVMFRKVRRHASAHRLVYRHFHGVIPRGMTINHKNGIKDDNRPENLELATQSEQILHAVRVLGTARAANQRGEKHHNVKLTDEAVVAIRHARVAGKTQTELARQYNVSQPTIADICHRRTWTHIQ
jgi:hypothetical protein